MQQQRSIAVDIGISNRKHSIMLLKGLALLILLWMFSIPTVKADDCTTGPTPELTPQDVVRVVVDALKNNPDDDSGIATVFCFASPGNRSITGPLDRFRRMLKGSYSDMLNHSQADFDAMKIENNTALQPVWLTTKTGDEIGYMFKMGKQTEGEFAGTWMTEAVFPIKRKDLEGQSI